MMGSREVIQTLLGGEPEPAVDWRGVFAGRVTRATPEECWFTIPSYDRHAEFGPALYPRPDVHTHVDSLGGTTSEPDYEGGPGVVPAGNPPRGTRLAVAFGGGDVNEPLVLAVYGWPA